LLQRAQRFFLLHLLNQSSLELAPHR